MIRFGAILRLLMLAACLVPFTNTRQAADMLAPIVPLAPLAAGTPANEAPGEDDERETDAKEHVTTQAKHHAPVHEQTDTLPPAARAHAPSLVRTTPPVPSDPFRNGLGTPYRC